MPHILSPDTGRNGEPERTFDRTRLNRFAHAAGRRDRSVQRAWKSDAELERAIRGYAYAVAIAEHSTIALSADDLDAAIAAYRRARHLAPRPDRSQRTLLTVVG